jgi:hypothetical protein
MKSTGEQYTPQALALYEAISAAPLETHYQDEADLPRNPTGIEAHIDRILVEFPDQVRITPADDGLSLCTQAFIPSQEYAGDAWISRVQTPDGQVHKTTLSGLYFLGRVTNDAYRVNALGKVDFIPIAGNPETQNTLKVRIGLYNKLRHLRNN